MMMIMMVMMMIDDDDYGGGDSCSGDDGDDDLHHDCHKENNLAVAPLSNIMPEKMNEDINKTWIWQI